MGRVRSHVWVTGKVQGVNYRFACTQEAERRRLGGWVKNLPDGRVEAVFEGDEATVKEMVEWCRKGPPAALVQGVDVRPEPPEGDPRFRVLR